MSVGGLWLRSAAPRNRVNWRLIIAAQVAPPQELQAFTGGLRRRSPTPPTRPCAVGDFQELRARAVRNAGWLLLTEPLQFTLHTQNRKDVRSSLDHTRGGAEQVSKSPIRESQDAINGAKGNRQACSHHVCGMALSPIGLLIWPFGTCWGSWRMHMHV